MGNLTLQLVEELKSHLNNRNFATKRRTNVENRDINQDYDMDNLATKRNINIDNRGIIHKSIPIIAKIAHFVTKLFDW